MPPGKATPPTRCPWPTATWSVGSAWWTSVAAPSCRRSFFPSVFNQVGAAAVQACLRDVFGRWGLPGVLRLDPGQPWGLCYGLPPALALWLVGLGVELDLLPVGHKQLNGVVEKSQDTGQRWAEPHTCASPAELQARLEEVDRLQREVYPSLQGQSRLAVFPQLRRPRQPYTRAWEQAHWQLRRAQEYLAGFTVERRANAQGQVGVYGHRYSVGAKQRGQPVWVYYDAGAGEWAFVSGSGQVLRRLAAVEITRERIVGLTVSS